MVLHYSYNIYIYIYIYIQLLQRLDREYLALIGAPL